MRTPSVGSAFAGALIPLPTSSSHEDMEPPHCSSSQLHFQLCDRWPTNRRGHAGACGGSRGGAVGSLFSSIARSFIGRRTTNASRPFASLTAASSSKSPLDSPTPSHRRRPSSTAHRRDAVPMFLNKLAGLPPEYLEPQAVAEHVHHFHQSTNGLFPRPCPRCSSGEFFVRRRRPQRNKGRWKKGSREDGGGGEAREDVSAVVDFPSRPVVCEMCQRWFHIGCLGIR